MMDVATIGKTLGDVTIETAPMLCDEHRAELHASGLTDETIEQAGIYTASDAAIRTIVGWQPRIHPWGRGFVVAFDGTYSRVKLDFPRHDQRGKPIKYESPRGAPNRAYFPPGFAELLQGSKLIIVTEGEKKALRIQQAGWPCVGLVGVWGWQEKRQRSDTGKAFGPRKLIEDLAVIEWKNYSTVICFDSDAIDNASVKLAESRFAEALTDRGTTVAVARPPGGDKKVGADDFIVEHGEDKFREVIESAEPAKTPASPTPMDWARMYLDECQRIGQGVTLRWHRDVFYGWSGRQYKRLPDSDLRGVLLQYLDGRGMAVTPRLAGDVLQCLASEVRVASDIEVPAYLSERGTTHPNWLALENGILDLDAAIRGEAVTLKRHSPRWFSPIALPYPYKADAECSVWFQTLDQFFDGDTERVDLLSEWFGYCLTEDTRFHAILLIEGPRRAGKGVTLRTLRSIVGEDNTVSPRLAGLSELFGLQGLIGKRLAITPDAHLGKGDRALATLETLKMISGEDAVEVHRKHLPSITTRLRTRFALGVNELPKFGDYSGALASRVIVLPYRLSFEGREDRDLETKLNNERPGILRWSLEGLARLHRQGGFTKPKASGEVEADFKRLVSPVRAFIEDRCEIRADSECGRDVLWDAWGQWCDENGHLRGSREVLGSRLRALIPMLKSGRLREGESRVRTYRGIRLGGQK